jgi:murein DD-endopeptidase MepM/ murein hydrolase activator NlpD
LRLAYKRENRGPNARTGYQLLALEIEGRREWHDSYYFDDARGASGFYDRTGRPIQRAIRHYPVEFSTITSRFRENRPHPVLNVTRPHYGVDFAAPAGTPVRAVARGKVAAAGWQGGAGRFVKLRHGASLASGYAHLARIAPGLKPGQRVRRGQVIGYVGSSGLATGSHLHFVAYKGGRYVDPMSVSFARSRSLRGRRLEAFRDELDRLDAAMTQPYKAEPIKTALIMN